MEKAQGDASILFPKRSAIHSRVHSMIFFPRRCGRRIGCLVLCALTFLPSLLSNTPTAAIASALPRSTAEMQGVAPAAIERFIAEITKSRIGGVHSFMLVRHGCVVAERWWAPHTPETPHVLNSLTKSFVGTAVGFAIADGKLNLDDPILKFFPREAPAQPDAALASLTVRDLLRMATGHVSEKAEALLSKGFPADFVTQYLALPFAVRPGEKFHYEPAASHLLSLIVQQVTAQATQDYLQSRLFDPLAIAAPRWDQSPVGTTIGCFGLYLRTEDLAKFGQLYLQKGRWGERQLLPASWVEAATSKEIDNPKVGGDPDWTQGYGYQFWRCRHDFYRADGAGGQLCIVMPQHDAVVVVTAQTAHMKQLMEAVWNLLLPGLEKP
jgi:CubicO group peptidase (beta-lactamase class C family)